MFENYSTVTEYVMTEDVLKKMSKDELIAYVQYIRSLFIDYTQAFYQSERMINIQSSLLNKAFDYYEARELLASRQKNVANLEFQLAEKYRNDKDDIKVCGKAKKS